MLVNELGPDADGTAIPHSLSHMVALEGPPAGSGLVLAHELGHFFGLVHKNNDATNLMNHNVSDSQLSNEQIEKAHESFANFSLLEKGVRVE